MIRKSFVAGALIASLGVAGVAAFGAASQATPESSRIRVRDDLAAMRFPIYARQKVVYQVDEAAGWFGHPYAGLLGSLRNHVAALGAANIDLRVVLHGKGVDLLRRPDARNRAALDALRAQGVRFLVCRNTLIETATEPADLHGTTSEDIVPAGVAEIADLQAKGFIYLHPRARRGLGLPRWVRAP